MANCFFTKLVTWKDPNLSAAFLTAGNVGVLLLWLTGNALSWALFALVFGVLPLGLVARLTGADLNVRKSLSRRPSTDEASTPSYYETHVVSQLTPVGLIRLGVYLVLASRLIELVGIAGALLFVGNVVMLLPLAYIKFSPIIAAQIRLIHLDKLLEVVRSTIGSIMETIASFGPMAPAVAGGLLTFFSAVIGSYLATSSALLVANLRLTGYIVILVFSIVPITLIEKSVSAIIPSASVVDKITERVQLSAATKRVTDLVLWVNYKNSVIAFASLYGFYYVSKYIGVMIPAALAMGLFVAYTLTPSTLKEKAFAEIDKTIGKVRESVVGPISNLVKTPPPQSPKSPKHHSPPASPKSGKKSPKNHQPQSPPAADKPGSPTPAPVEAGAGDEEHPISPLQLNGE